VRPLRREVPVFLRERKRLLRREVPVLLRENERLLRREVPVLLREIRSFCAERCLSSLGRST